MTEAGLFDGGAVIAGAAAGLILGLAYFAGLWLTTQRLKGARSPGLMLAASWVIRLGLLLGGAYAVTRGAPGSLAAFLIGFWIARWLALRWAKGSMQTGR